MADLTTLRDLERRLEAAAGADLILDRDIHDVLTMPMREQMGEKAFGSLSVCIPRYTASLDAAVALCRHVLHAPIIRPVIDPYRPKASVSSEAGRTSGKCETAELSLCLATIRALIASNTEGSD